MAVTPKSQIPYAPTLGPKGRVIDAQSFARVFDVSRETIERLATYEALLRKWQKAINLVAPKSLDEVWNRHFADSAQLADLVPPTARRIADLGSGAGFPGLVLAIMLAGRDNLERVTLVESDQRKSAFLRDVSRAVDIPVEVLSTRIEESATVKALADVDVLTARALAPLPRLLRWIAPLYGSDTIALLLKGRDCVSEVEQARLEFEFDVALIPSATDSDAQIAAIRRLVLKREGEP